MQSTPATHNKVPRQASVQTHEAQSNHNEQSSRQNGGPRNPGEPNRTNVQTHQTQNKTLLIGDSILSGVNRKGLKNNVLCAPFPGATIDIISKNISMYDLTQFENVVIYCGGNDSAKPNIVENVRKGYDTLLKFIKNKNSECMVYLCSSCPRGDTDKTDVNKVIKTMTVAHGGSYVDAYSAFYDNNNDLRTKFYNPRDWIHLSNSGIKRLLGTINLVVVLWTISNSVFISRCQKINPKWQTCTKSEILETKEDVKENSRTGEKLISTIILLHTAVDLNTPHSSTGTQPHPLVVKMDSLTLIPKMTMIITNTEVHLNTSTIMDNTVTETRIMVNTMTEMKIMNNTMTEMKIINNTMTEM